jgi:hypothetical protein
MHKTTSTTTPGKDESTRKLLT